MTYTNLLQNPVDFVSPGATGQVDITVNDGALLQSMLGFGATLSVWRNAHASMADVNQNSANYWSILNTLFDPTDGANAAGLSYLRVPLGASDFSGTAYSFDDEVGDTALKSFDVNKAPSYLFSVIRDIQGINPYLKLHVLPWSPPGWMKDSGTIKGGSFKSEFTGVYANYLLKSLQGLQSHAISAYAIGIQNEPENDNPTYPTCLITADQEAKIGAALRPLLDANGFSDVRIVGYEHNWDDAGNYPVQLMEDAGSAFSGAAFHCYEGDVSQQDAFHNAFANKGVYFTECTGSYGTDWWENIKWYMDNIFIGAVNHGANSGLMWNLALDGNGNPKLPGTASCSTPCRPVVTVNGDGSYSYNEDFYVMAQASKAVLPRDKNGPFGQRVAVDVGGSLSGLLLASAFKTGRTNASDYRRYSLVVLNWNDNQNGKWNPTPIEATIAFRGKQARYTFPVGVTTLWWYAE
ncbi:glycoside hydrolase [Trametes maxima]|nr:glycoside hydrolase [Trametes maxima]